MTAKTFTITIPQMRAIFEAGRQSGMSGPTAFCRGNDDDFIEAMDDFINDSTKWGSPDHVDWSAITKMVKEA